MKHLYTIIATLTFGIFAIAQVPTVDFETNGACFITPSTGNSGTVSIVDDGVDAATYGKVANIVDPATEYDSWKIRLDNKISFADAAKKVLSVDFRDPTATARVILLKVTGGSDTYVNANNEAVTAYEVSVTSQATDAWQTLEFDFSSANGSYPNNAVTGKDLVGEYSGLDIFIDFGTAVGSNTFVDNIRGGTQGSDNSNPGPTANPADPTATHAAADVMSIYSDAYTSVATNWVLNPGWGQATTTSETGVDPCDVQDSWIRMTNLNFQGHQFDAVDVSGMTNIHFDVWVENAGDLSLALISTGPNEGAVASTLTAGSWQSIDIPLTDFTTANTSLDLTDIFQMKWEGAAALGYIYIDNIYFWAPPSTDTDINFTVDTTNNSHHPNTTNGELLAVSYSTDGGSTYALSNPFADDDADGVWEGTLTLAKTTGEVKYKLVTTDPNTGHSTANASTGDALAAEADFSVTTGANAVGQSLFLVDRDASASSWATLTASATVDVAMTIRGIYPGQTAGQYGIRNVNTSCYNIVAITSVTDQVWTGTMTLPFYSTQTYQVAFHNDSNGWCGDNMVSNDATSGGAFSVTVVEDPVAQDLTALSAVDANGNYLVYTSSLSVDDLNFLDGISIYPNPTMGMINISGIDKVDSIKAFSIGGQLIKEATNTNTLDLSSERSGLYMIELQHEGATSVSKLIIR